MKKKTYTCTECGHYIESKPKILNPKLGEGHYVFSKWAKCCGKKMNVDIEEV